MAFWILDQWDGGTLDYPTLGFRADPGDVLEASAAPDPRWSSTGSGPETVTRYTVGSDPSYVEPGDGHVLTWSDTDNAYVPAAPTVVTGQINANDYGVTGNGSTNDTDALQAWIDATAAAKGLGFLPQGVYRYTTLTIPQGDGFTLRGSSCGGTILQLAPGKAWNTTPAITTLATGAPARGTANLLIENITFDGNASGRSEPPRWLQTPAGVEITDPEADYFANGGKIGDPAHAADADAVAASQSRGSAGNLTLTSSPYTPSSVRKITITSAGNDSARTFTVTGTDINDSALVSQVAGTNAGTATTSVVFKTVTQIAVDGATASTVTAGVAAFDIFGTVAEGRRNPDYTNTFGLLRLYCTEDTVVRNCRFINHKGYGIIEAGGRNVTIEGNVFDNLGKNDGPYQAIWTQSFGTPGSGGTFTDSENIQILNNRASSLERSFVLFAPTKGGRVIGNNIDNWGESGIFTASTLHYNGGRSEIAGNVLRTGRLTDIAAAGIETNNATDVWIHHNTIEDCDGHGLAVAGAIRTTVNDNEFRDCYNTTTYPYGPFSERYGFNVGGAPIAGNAWDVASGAVVQIGTLSGVGCDALRIRNNTFVETRGSYPAVFEQVQSGGSSLSKNTTLEGNDVTSCPSAMTFLDTSATGVWEANMSLSVRGNPGHASESPVVHTKQFAAGETGTYTVTCGFRPRAVRVYAAENNATGARASIGEFTWNRAAVRNDFVVSLAATSGSGQNFSVAPTDVIRLVLFDGTVRFLAEFTAWTETGFTLNVITAVAVTNVRFVCKP